MTNETHERLNELKRLIEKVTDHQERLELYAKREVDQGSIDAVGKLGDNYEYRIGKNIKPIIVALERERLKAKLTAFQEEYNNL